MYKFKFADIGEGLHEGTVAEIYVKVGQQVEEGDSLFSVETDKVTSDIPSPVSGKIAKIEVKVGQLIHVGEEVFHIDDGTGATEAAAPAPKAEEAPVAEEAKEEAKEAPKAEEKQEEAASVVGSIEVSNNLFSFDMFKSKEQIEKEKKAMGNASLPTTGDFDWTKIVAKGEGEAVDAVIIGAGPGGYRVAEFVAKAGLKTVVVEKEKAGGVCLNVGCIPTKALLKSAAVLEMINKSAFYGLDLKGSVSLNWKQMQKRKSEVVDKLVSGVEFLMKSVKAELVKGEAEVIDKHNVKVGNRLFTTKIIILATGSTPIMIPLPGFQKAQKDGLLIDSTGALNLPKIPKSLTVIGGGVIGVEFAVLYAELGTKVTILEGGPSILGPLDNDVKKFANDLLKEKGIEVLTNAKVTKITAGAVKYDYEGKTGSVKSEKVLLSVGRRPNNLGLDKTIGLAVDQRGAIKVNSRMQTSINNIFAIGDATGQSMLAHSAYKHAHVVRSVLRQEGKIDEWDVNKVPACVYTHPEISMIGKTEEQLKAEGVQYVKAVYQNKNVGKVLSDGDEKGFAKLLIDKKHGEVLGAHIVNNNASDMIAEIATLMETEGTIYELVETVHPHPSISEVIYEAALHAIDQLEK